MNAIANAKTFTPNTDNSVQIANDHEPRLSRDYAIKGMLWSGDVAIMPGPSNAGKTAMAILMGWHVCAGEAFAGRRVRRGAVVHVAAERPDSVLNRAATLFKLRGRRDLAPYFVYGERINLTDPESVGMLIDRIRAFMATIDAPLRLVTIDTAVLCMGDADENSSRDVTIIIEGLKQIAAATGAVVLTLHHTGNEGNRSRGSSAWRSNHDADFPLMVVNTKEGEHVELQDAKARDNAKGLKIRFRVEGHLIGQDDDGDDVTVAVARLLDDEEGAAVEGPRPERDRGVDPDRQRATEILKAMRTLGERNPTRMDFMVLISTRN
jgi:putative DNA primase/helicase